MNTLAMKKLNRTQTNPMNRRRNLLSFGMFGTFDWSKILKPKPPIVNRKLDADPSLIYCPVTLWAKKATGLYCPYSLKPTRGGSTITA